MIRWMQPLDSAIYHCLIGLFDLDRILTVFEADLVGDELGSPSTSIVSGAAPAEELQESAMGYRVISFTWKSRTLNAGLSIAACRAQPLATHSSKFNVFEQSRPKKVEMRLCTAGMRTLPPKISTTEMSSFEMLWFVTAPSIASARTLSSFSRAGMHACKKSSRSTMALTSMSSMKHSMLMGACGLALRTFLVFSQATSKRYMAFLLDNASIPCFSFHSAAKRFASNMSKSRPPK
mmetsp:Transcript_48780/g.120994  ORF Transcript_48780/g.120994 Transcript_48780/m.120994 type:complete len:235 (-) Transcript_48780:765-1469(-)